MYIRTASVACIFVLLMGFEFTDAASLRLAPPRNDIEVGDLFSMAVQITSTDQAMNASSGVVQFPSDLLQVVTLSKAGSVIGLWAQEPSFSNDAGTINFEGVVLNPGFIGSNATMVTITFRARAEGTANVTISGGSVLANDGNGTEIYTGSSGGTVTISPESEQPVPTPRSTPVKEKTPTLEPVATSTPAEVMSPAQKTTIEKPFDISWLWSWASTPFQSIVFALLLIAILIFLILDALLLYKYIRVRRGGSGSLSGAQKYAHRSFLLLRDDVDAYVEALKKESESRKLTPVEERFVREMKTDLSDAEKNLMKELRNADRNG